MISRVVILKTLILLFIISNNFARTLPIQPIIQEQSNTCWAAISRMTLLWWGHNVDEEDIVDYGTNGENIPNFLSGGPHNACDLILWMFGDLNSYATTGHLVRDDIVTEIEKQFNPILVSWSLTAGGAHHVLIVGQNSNGTEIVYNDPGMGIGKQLKMSYTSFVGDSEHNWDGSLRITQAHPEIGILDGVIIVTDTSKILINQGIASSFESKFIKAAGSNAYADRWDWRLYFPHRDGEYVAASITDLYGYNNSTWNVSGFSLPSGYLWNYTYPGTIIGKLTVSTVDSDGYPHSDTRTVEFVPQNMIPGVVIYANQTVSTAQPDVVAHYRVQLQYDQFQPGGDITFRAGQEINIGNGVTIENGAITDFVIEPSLQY